MAENFDNVRILFLCADDKPVEYVATVVTRSADMVIDIAAQPAGGPYLVRGQRADAFFAGRDEIDDVDPVDVVARWAKLGDVWIGIWIEDGVEYLFTFKLPARGLGSLR